jgi:hypothetical protein
MTLKTKSAHEPTGSNGHPDLSYKTVAGRVSCLIATSGHRVRQAVPRHWIACGKPRRGCP